MTRKREGSIKCFCFHCGIPISRTPSQLNKSGRVFCGRECFYKGGGGKRTTKRSDTGILKTSVIKKCSLCNSDIIVIRVRIAKKNYCNMDCYMGDKTRPIGTKMLSENGYVTIKTEDKSSGWGGWKKEHRHVMEQKLGRKLIKNEHVHHINGDRSDNRIENLELWTRSHPYGQRVGDKVKWAREIIRLYDHEFPDFDES